MSTQTNLNVSLTRQLMNKVRERVDGGQYQSASEVVREGLRLLDEREKDKEAYWSDVRKKVKEAQESLRAGKGIPAEVFRKSMKKYIRDFKSKSRRPGKIARLKTK
jgi:antitoxin ParD1/3/4